MRLTAPEPAWRTLRWHAVSTHTPSPSRIRHTNAVAAAFGYAAAPDAPFAPTLDRPAPPGTAEA
jgi:hypothetical protein